MTIVRTWIVLTSSGTFTRPVDWNPFDNTIEGIGSGKNGSTGTSTFGGGGAAGGCYAKISNVDLPASVNIQVGTPAALDTVFGALLTAKGGQSTTLGCVGQLIFAGGAGAPGVSNSAGSYGGGGGGAAGPSGAGLPASAYNGGRGDAGAGGAGGVSAPGAPGDEWPGLAGAGGGGGDGGAVTGFAGGLYGGGGAGGGCANAAAHGGGAGGPGVIVISYTPWIVGTMPAVEGADVASLGATDAWLGAMGAAEAADVASIAGSVAWTARMAAVEAPDVAAVTAIDATLGPLIVTEIADHPAFFGQVYFALALGATEGPDVAAFHALAFFPNTLAAFEDPDTAEMHGLTADFGPMAAREEPDVAAMTVQLGPLWPPILGVWASVEGGDSAAINCLADPVGHLEFYGVGASTLYHAASPLERAMADVEVARMMGLPARLITENLDPWKVQSGDNLIFLAYSLGATLWEDNWSELTKRAWLAEQWKFKSLVGTLSAIEMALVQSGYDVTNIITPPGGFFISPDLTTEETNAWLRKMPQIRIKFASKTEIEGLDELFADDGYIGDALTIDNGRALYGRVAVIRNADGTETPLEITDGSTEIGQIAESISLPVLSPLDFFVDEDALGEDKFASADAAATRLFSVFVDQWNNVTTADAALTALTPGLIPLSPRFEIDSDTEIDTAPSLFANDWTPGVEYVTPDNGPILLANVMYLLDPSITAPMTISASYVDDARIGIPSDYAELTIDLHQTLPLPSFIASDSFADDNIFYLDEDLSAVEQAFRAIIAGKALRDTILVEFYGTPLTYVPPSLPGGFIAATMRAVEDPDEAAFVGGSTISGFMAAVEGPDLGNYFVSGVMLALEGPDAFFGTAQALHAFATMAAVEGPDVAAIIALAPADTGVMAAVEGADACAMVGAVTGAGAMAAAEQPDVAAMAGGVAWAAAMAATEIGDHAALSGVVTLQAALAATEAPDVAAMVGAVVVSGALAATEAPDAAAFVGGVVITNAMAALEGPDLALMVGKVAWAATMPAVEGADVAVIIGAVLGAGTMAVVEGADVAAASGAVFDGAALIGIEGADAAAFSGSVAWRATMAAVEGPDTCFATSAGTGVGAMAAFEGPDAGGLSTVIYSDGVFFIVDTTVAVGSVYWQATIATTEAPDVAAMAATVAWSATMAAVEAADIAFATSAAQIFGTMSAVEGPDAGGLQTVIYSDGVIFVVDTEFAIGSVYWPAACALVEGPDVAAIAGIVGALLDETGNPLLDETGNIIITEP